MVTIVTNVLYVFGAVFGALWLGIWLRSTFVTGDKSQKLIQVWMPLAGAVAYSLFSAEEAIHSESYIFIDATIAAAMWIVWLRNRYRNKSVQ